MVPETKSCENCKTDFTVASEDFDFYAKMDVPAPRFCPACRLQGRMATFNVRTIYNRICDLCSKKMISMYRPDSPYTVYCFACYFSDKWDPLDYGSDYDFSKDFFTQFNDLMLRIPHLCLEQINNNGEGCEYANYTYKSSNVYLSYNVAGCENIFYSMFANKENKMCFDSLNFKANELCYEIVDSHENYMCSFLTKSQQCISSSFLFNCVNCQDCFMSSNKRNKRYVFRNRQCTKEEYLHALEDIQTTSGASQEALKQEYKDMMGSSIVRFATLINAPDCSGDVIENSKNVKHAFYVWNSENLKYVTYSVNTMKDSYDLLDGGRGERMYQLVCNGRGCYNTAFCFSVGNARNCFYGSYCNDLKDAFGCVNIKSKDYCILNKQYDKEAYEDLRQKIVAQMKQVPYVDKQGHRYFYGDFFPIELSPFAYNETLAVEEFPLAENEARALGYRWVNNDAKSHKADMHAADLPDDLSDASPDLSAKILRCLNEGEVKYQCTSAYRILPEELSFYKRMKLPLPKWCPNCRYYMRRSRMLPMKLWPRQCMCREEGHGHLSGGSCPNRFETPYAEDRPEKVYCEGCYQKEII